MTETDVVNLRRTIYLTIMSSLDFEEAGHKLLRIKINPGWCFLRIPGKQGLEHLLVFYECAARPCLGELYVIQHSDDGE